ncbi:2-amino-4-hydroxy-6-hydroxymethyldihydropteridine diphosphokinase [Streptococcus ratti]|uniref:2-amino-4-hydroxy-6-hydroxymethyldihydropteridine diphosphokinase n=1 Tax=Streptococcus ratti TaxID=1341 RepID=A0A7X9LC58_STRRT|nr:2-amino-4-hydroxy-6-hydroxymethyldihydropteridine diphosphokinase [Streptococcus ratti]NMD48184.1 2-amino-4-hydroxy-6-hydroxymethyldihydropteridine diphosphokinase [Streptococcus ratti]
MTAVYLGLGSNIENREAYLEKALASLAELPQTQLVDQSAVYETAAWGKTDQADFLNVVCQLETDLSPQELLQSCQSIEGQLGRIRHEHWGPRTIDIDILFYGYQIIDEEDLQVPHPYLQDRAFVLVPLNDLARSFIHPLLKQSIADLLQRVDKSGVKPLKY